MIKTVCLFVCVVFLVPVHSCLTSCPALWTGFNGNCYRLFHDHRTFESAESACREFKLRSCNGDELAAGHLASIHSQEEQNFLKNLVQTSLPTLINNPSNWDPQVYHGMKVGDTNSDQTWTDGSDVDYDGWFTGEPNNGPNSVGVVAAGSHSGGLWADVYSSASLKYLCMLPCVEYDVE